MRIDDGLARLSDNSFVVAVVVYSVAMLLSAAEYAFGCRSRGTLNR